MEESKKPRRKPLSKKIRFEVFKRDGFTCQYCGRMAPDVVLEVDHINPVANGGENDIMNLVTSCQDCNRGKGKRKLSSKDEIKAQQAQLKELSAKREQLQMLIEWRKELESINNMQVGIVQDIFSECTGSTFTETGKKKIAKFIKKYGINEVCEAVQIYIDSYYDSQEDRFIKNFETIGGICFNRERQKTDESIYWVNKIAYAANKKFDYLEKWKVRNILQGKVHSEEECEYLLDIVGESSSWSDLKDSLLEALE